ncbi:MAG: hypothetical protein AB7P76_09625 [Candidatus Melainabacteria bacterium]
MAGPFPKQWIVWFVVTDLLIFGGLLAFFFWDQEKPSPKEPAATAWVKTVLPRDSGYTVRKVYDLVTFQVARFVSKTPGMDQEFVIVHNLPPAMQQELLKAGAGEELDFSWLNMMLAQALGGNQKTPLSVKSVRLAKLPDATIDGQTLQHLKFKVKLKLGNGAEAERVKGSLLMSPEVQSQESWLVGSYSRSGNYDPSELMAFYVLLPHPQHTAQR